MSPGRAALGGVSVGDGLPVVAVGVVNLSPESFHAGSVYTRDDDLLGAALGMVEAGAALIDVGARSTAPYLDAALDEAEERDRLVRAVELLARKLPVPISADTARPAPARAALEAGARVINDVSGLRDPAVAALVVKHHASVILMSSPDLADTLSGAFDVTHALGVISAYLFGRHAAGTAHRESDVDVGVLLDWRAFPDAAARFDERVRLRDRRERGLIFNQPLEPGHASPGRSEPCLRFLSLFHVVMTAQPQQLQCRRQRQPLNDGEQVRRPGCAQQLRTHRDAPRLRLGQVVHGPQATSSGTIGSAVNGRCRVARSQPILDSRAMPSAGCSGSPGRCCPGRTWP